MQDSKTIRTDILVIGAGGAGLRAALAAAAAGSRVLVLNKGPVARSGITLTAAGGMQAPFHPDDSAELYYEDTIQCGYQLADKDLAWMLASEACQQVLALERYGCRFVRDSDGKFALGTFPGQSRPRNLFVKGGGLGLVSGLARACQAQPNLTIHDDFLVTGLLRADAGGDPAVAGAFGVDLRDGKSAKIAARAVILATGGCQWLWEVNDCPTDAAGDGVAFAGRIGAELVDMEMVLFYPSVIVWPPSLQGAFVHYEFLAEAILDGNVYDRHGAAVLPKPLPVRDEAMRLMERAIRDGRDGDHGGLLWYVGDSPKGLSAVRKQLDLAQYNYIKAHGVDPATARIEVAPGAHYLLGGVRIDARCRTSVAGLFATPECAGNFDGANRLAGSGIGATQVFGAKAGLCAHDFAAASPLREPDPVAVAAEQERIRSKFGKPVAGAPDLYELRRRLRTAVQRYAGVNRNAEGLRQLIRIAGEVREAAAVVKVPDTGVFNQQLMDLLQLEIMGDVAGWVAGSALWRTESRGHHFREDYPQRDDAAWLCHTTLTVTADGPRCATAPVRGK